MRVFWVTQDKIEGLATVQTVLHLLFVCDFICQSKLVAYRAGINMNLQDK